MSVQQKWIKLCEHFSGLPVTEKAKLLSLLLCATTMTARAFGEPGTEEVLNPRALRRLAELVHRISQFQHDILYEIERRSDEDFFRHVDYELSAIGFGRAVYDMIDKDAWNLKTVH